MHLSQWLGLMVGIIFSLNVLAQETTETTTSIDQVTESEEIKKEEQEASKPAGRVEKIEVTGSHIKRIDVEGPSPVLTLDRDYLDNTGYNSVGDVLRDTTVASLGGDRESALSSGAGAGAQTTSLRGFGSGDILVLLDGQRLPAIGGTTSVDLNLIPMAAIERIEILKDGASAIYGSDALGGVINFITKKNYDGATVMIQQSLPEEIGGAKTDVVGSYGKTGSNYSILGVLQYKNNSNIKLRARDFASPKGPSDFSSFGNPGSWSDDDETTFNPGGTADPCPPERVINGVCSFDYSPYMQIIPDTQQVSSLVSGTYDLSENLKFFGRAIYVNREVKGQLAPPPDRFFDNSSGGGTDTRISENTFDNIWGAGNATGPVSVRYRLVDEAGPRKSTVGTDAFSIDTGAKGYFLNSWEWKVSTAYGVSNTTNTGTGGFAIRSQLKTLADAGQFNPFAPQGSKNDISSALYSPVEKINSSIGGVYTSATGELLEMPAGPLGLAMGVSSSWQTFEQSADATTAALDQWGGAGANTGKGNRDFQSTYLEFSIPAFTGMEFQAAGRFDNFSDFGTTVNPKLAFRYKPINMLMFRGSWGTGFKAPALFNLYGDASISYPQATDPVTGLSQQYQTIGGGNRRLKEEKSDSLNFGMVIEPMDRMSFSVDHYMVKQDSIVSNLATAVGLRDILRAEKAFGNPYLNGFGVNVQRTAPGGPITFIEAPAINLSTREIKGFDFRYAYNPKLFGSWNLNFIMDHSVLIELIEEPFPGLGKENRAGFQGYPFWKNYITLGTVNQSHGINFIIKTIGEQNASEEEEIAGTSGKTRDHTEVDFRYTYNAPWNGTFALGALNVFGIKRPESLDNGTTGAGYLNATIYDPIGRAYYLSYTQNF